MPTLPCPTCQRPVAWSPEATWRPFCSERCKLIDLGAWITEKHAIPGEEISPDSTGGNPSHPSPGGDDEPPRH